MTDFKERANAAGGRLFDGRAHALEEVVDLYQKKIYNLAYRFTGDSEEAFDLSQEIFFRSYTRIKYFTPGTDFNAWFMRLAVNASINYKSKIGRNPSHAAFELIEDSGTCSDNHSVDKMEEQLNRSRISFFLGQLPKRERMAITLQLWEKKKVKEISELMGTSVKSVESLLTRARKRMKKIIKKSEGFGL